MLQANLTTTTTSVTTSQFPTSNGISSLPNSSPVQNQHQFSDIMKVRLAQVQVVQQQQQQPQSVPQQQQPSQQQPTSTSNQSAATSAMPQAPSPFSNIQQQNNQQQNQQFNNNRPLSASTPGDASITTSTPQTIPPPASSGPSPSPVTTTNGPQSTTSTPNTPIVPSLMTPNQTVSSANQTPPHPGTTPSPAGLASLGKGMTSQERAALNAPRSSNMSSQMAAITAALDRDNSPSPPMNNNKGKLDSIKEENIKMEIKSEDGSEIEWIRDRMDGGKNVNNDVSIKTEIKKTEPMEEGSAEGIVKEEPGIKEESVTSI
ncbi:PREDICTED: putative mediator of RNA polymerase II transcription subunit 26, partial [Polistes canadensis]|uniref:putative mediator of RNA polymerase II transcription subunit 26 n=1 Tax=Polistes canadensis TaxID=91411 RepID=UPI000718C0F3